MSTESTIGTSQITKKEENAVGIVIDLSSSSLPNLEEAQVFPFNLGGEYWTPEKEGESKRVFFVEIKPTELMSQDGKGLIELDCAYLLVQDEDLNTNTIYNGSRVLVGIIESSIESGTIQKGTPLEIRYEGKKKNKRNAYSSDRWSVKPLIINIKAKDE